MNLPAYLDTRWHHIDSPTSTVRFLSLISEAFITHLLSINLIIMSPQHSKKLEDVEDINDNPGYDISVLSKPPPQVPSELRKAVNLYFNCGSYNWNVHRGPLVEHSKVFEMMTSVHFKVKRFCSAAYATSTDFTQQEGQEQTIDLPEDEPELIARMIHFCYFGKYSLSPITPPAGVPHAKTVEGVMRGGFWGERKDFETLYEPACDAVLHMKMYDVADKYDVERLRRYAMKKIWSSLHSEEDAFWPCVDQLSEMADLAAEEVIQSCLIFASRISASSRVHVDFEGARFKSLESERPEMAKSLKEQACYWQY